MTTTTLKSRSYRRLQNGNLLVTANGVTNEYSLTFKGQSVAVQKDECEIYTVDMAKKTCDCKGFRFGKGKPCKHIALCCKEVERRDMEAAKMQEEWNTFDR